MDEREESAYLWMAKALYPREEPFQAALKLYLADLATIRRRMAALRGPLPILGASQESPPPAAPRSD